MRDRSLRIVTDQFDRAIALQRTANLSDAAMHPLRQLIALVSARSA